MHGCAVCPCVCLCDCLKDCAYHGLRVCAHTYISSVRAAPCPLSDCPPLSPPPHPLASQAQGQTQDPYVILTIGRHTMRTPAARAGGESPVWSAHCTFQVGRSRMIELVLRSIERLFTHMVCPPHVPGARGRSRAATLSRLVSRQRRVQASGAEGRPGKKHSLPAGRGPKTASCL